MSPGCKLKSSRVDLGIISTWRIELVATDDSMPSGETLCPFSAMRG
jgi:hypothetical protein